MGCGVSPGTTSGRGSLVVRKSAPPRCSRWVPPLSSCTISSGPTFTCQRSWVDSSDGLPRTPRKRAVSMEEGRSGSTRSGWKVIIAIDAHLGNANRLTFGGNLCGEDSQPRARTEPLLFLVGDVDRVLLRIQM